MYELIRADDDTWYIDCPSKIGVCRTETGLYAIDSGNDKDAGRKLRQIFDRQGWTLTGILTTHSHADHIGGNKYLQGTYHCPVFANAIETAFIEHPILEPSYLFGGYPPADLRHKFLLAPASSAKPLTDPAYPPSLTPVPLPGHSIGHTGYTTKSGIFFIGDALCGKETLDKYTITVLSDISSELQTLRYLETSKAELYIPSHAKPETDITSLVQYNRDKIFAVRDRILELCREPQIFETVLQKLFAGYGLIMNFEQYVLVGSTLKSYLSWMKEEQHLDIVFEDNRLLWRAHHD